MPSAKADIYTVGEFFLNYALKVPLYQRDFSWEEKEIRILFQDLFQAYEEVDPNGELKSPEYFLGAIVTQEEPGGVDWLVDGQQRVTCLCMLMCALTLDCSAPVKARLLELLRREDKNTFVLQVDGYDKAFRDFLAGLVPKTAGRRRTKSAEPLAITRLRAAFGYLRNEVAENLPDQDQVDSFAEWMLANVFFAHIQDTDPEDSERLFDRINTRGKQLSVADVFRGQVLGGLSSGGFEPFRRPLFMREWNEMRRVALVTINAGATAKRIVDPLDAEGRLLTAWLIGRYAGVAGEDGIATAVKSIKCDPYPWAHENLPLLGRGGPEPMETSQRLRSEFFKFVEWAEEVVAAHNRFDPKLPGFRTAHLMKIDLSLALTAAIASKRKAAWRKVLPILSRFLDVVGARRGWMASWKSPASLEMLMLEAIPLVRRHSERDLGLTLSGLVADAPDFDPRNAPALAGASNKAWLRYMLSRFSWRLAAGMRERIDPAALFDATGDQAMEIEHLMGNDFQTFRAAFRGDYEEFRAMRDRLGALTLLPKAVNAGLQAKPYESKLDVYQDQTPITQTLSVRLYDARHRFRGLADSHELKLIPIEKMSPKAVELREETYAAIANDIWSPRRIATPR